MTGNVSFLLGAGFSAPFNIPTMRPFFTSFRDFAYKKYPQLQETLREHVDKLPSGEDIEGLLFSLSKAEELPIALPSIGHMNDELRRWTSESRLLKAHLISYIIERCEQFDREQADQAIGPLLVGLSESKKLSKVHFFTTNYDRILEYVSDTHGITLDDGFGAPDDNLVAPWTAEFENKVRLYKLHGSVTYYVDRQRDAEKEFLRLDRGYPLPGPDFRLSREGRALEPLMVLPTLEKDAMDDPYGHLMHVFTETLSNGGLLITMGTSLRDAHLVSALSYSVRKVVLLVIDREPELTISQLPAANAVPLRVDMAEGLFDLADDLIELSEECAKISCTETLQTVVDEFAGVQSARLESTADLSAEQKKKVDILRLADGESNKLEAIRSLQGLSHPEIIRVVAACLTAEHSPAVRKAAAGCLGLGKSSSAVGVLGEAAGQDNAPDVRLEAYLALKEIGGDEAEEALKIAKGNWPEDPFFWDEIPR